MQQQLSHQSTTSAGSHRATRAARLLASASLLLVALVIVVMAGLPNRADYTGWTLNSGQYVAPELGALAPPVEGVTVDGQALSLADLRGAPVVLNFWATWCVPCAVEMPELQQLYETHRADGLRVLAANMAESPPLVRAWRDTHSLTFDLLLDPDGAIAQAYRVRAWPSTFVISPTGVITQVYFGPVSAQQLTAALAPFIAQE